MRVKQVKGKLGVKQVKGMMCVNQVKGMMCVKQVKEMMHVSQVKGILVGCKGRGDNHPQSKVKKILFFFNENKTKTLCTGMFFFYDNLSALPSVSHTYSLPPLSLSVSRSNHETTKPLRKHQCLHFPQGG